MFSKNTLEMGAEAPKLIVTTETGEALDLEEIYSKGPVLIYFYPKADTPGCTKQACNLRDNFAELEDAGVIVLGVSKDSVENQLAFKEKYNLPFTLIADTEMELANAIGVGSMFGLGFKRQSFLFVDGKLIWKDLKASPQSQTEDALKALATPRN